MGQHTAINVKRFLLGKTLKTFHPSHKPIILSFGDLNTYLITEKVIVSGTILSFLKEGIYQYVMPGFDPAGTLVSTIKTSKRIFEGTISLGFPTLMSLTALKKLTQIRLLSGNKK